MTGEARQSLKTELAHARKGRQYYQRRVEHLEKQLEKLKSKTNGRGRADPNLPRTTMQFWLGLVGKRPKTTEQIVQAAIKKFKLEDAPTELIAKLRLRWSVGLISLVKEGRILDDGKGRTRTFRLP